jgi:alkylation response protein AidB-like acyl-CoA dehydrogenase
MSGRLRSLRQRASVAGLLYSGTNDIQKNIIARWLGL